MGTRCGLVEISREALETKRDRREILEQLLEDHFNQPEFQKYVT